MKKNLPNHVIERFENILSSSSVEKEIKNGSLNGKDKHEIKAFAITKAVKLKKYVRN